jgi:hypothetical protein
MNGSSTPEDDGPISPDAWPGESYSFGCSVLGAVYEAEDESDPADDSTKAASEEMGDTDASPRYCSGRFGVRRSSSSVSSFRSRLII